MIPCNSTFKRNDHSKFVVRLLVKRYYKKSTSFLINPRSDLPGFNFKESTNMYLNRYGTGFTGSGFSTVNPNSGPKTETRVPFRDKKNKQGETRKRPLTGTKVS